MFVNISMPWYSNPSVSEADSINSGMIATGNHGDFDSLRGAQPQRGSRGCLRIRPGIVVIMALCRRAVGDARPYGLDALHPSNRPSS